MKMKSVLNHLVSKEIKIEFTYEVLTDNQIFTHGFNLFNSNDVHIISSHDVDSKTLLAPVSKGVYKASIIIPRNFLVEGGYKCSFAIMKYNPFTVEFHEMETVGFSVIDELDDTEARGSYNGKLPGLVRLKLNWE
ncbi:MAG: hypothetical protein QM710_11970 [Flavobacterium sp.]